MFPFNISENVYNYDNCDTSYTVKCREFQTVLNLSVIAHVNLKFTSGMCSVPTLMLQNVHSYDNCNKLAL